ncbi:MAG: biopolymer transporter ExbD [Isosphaeraceae bacterium]
MSASVDSMKAEPDLTPLLDVVFQLITFFMLVINFSNDNFDQRVKLPVAGTARPVEERERVAEDRLVLNIDKEGHLLMNGQAMPMHKAVSEIKHQADLVKLNLKAAGQKPGDNGMLPTTIVLRADKDVEFSSFYGLLTACQSNGFYKFALKAMDKSE